MFKILKRFPAPLALLLAGLTGCPEAPPSPANDPMSATVINGRAPLNAGGRIRISASGGFGDDKLYEGDIDDAGRFSVNMRGTFGAFIFEAVGGSYVEAATGTVVRHAEALRAALLDVKQLERAEVAITPWTEIAFSKGGLDGYADGLRALNDTLGCQNTSYAKLLATPPSVPSTDGPIQSLSVEALAYLYLGAFSQLSADLSDQLDIQPGSRLTSMGLTKKLAADFSDGRIDGRQAGAKLYLIDGHPLPENLLRQPLAQALRRFVNGPKNESSLAANAVFDLLSCVSMGTDPQLGPTGEPLDTDGPIVKIVTPHIGSYLASPQDLVCEASDISGVRQIRASLKREADDLSAALGLPVLTMEAGAGSARIVVPLLIQNLETGKLLLRCDSVDVWGNASVDEKEVHVNRGGRAPRLVLDNDDPAQVASTVHIRCVCDDDPYSHRCELAMEHGEPLSPIQSGDRWSLYSWDTRLLLDGPHTLTCGNWSRGIRDPITHSFITRIKNHDRGSVTGIVYLDSPVEHVTVVAFAYQNGDLGAELGTAEAVEGAFSVPVSNEYRGPVLLVAERSRNPALNQPQAQFKNVPLGATVPLSNGKLRLLIEHYEPGQHLTSRSINIATTMGESLASAFWKQKIDDPASFVDAIRTSHRLIGQYLSPTRPFDVRETHVAYLGQVARQAGDNEILLGLFHVGLSRLAVEYSVQHCRRRTCITVPDIIEAMRQDLTDGRLDGRGPGGARPSLGHGAYLGEDFFRIELAQAIRRWLDGTPFMDDHQASANDSGLNPGDFGGRAQFLQTLAAHDSQLFGNRPGATYDDEGPVLSVQVLDVNGNDIGHRSAFGRTRFRLVVEGSDDTGVAWIRAALNGNPLANSQPSRAEHAEYWVDTSAIPDGDAQVVITSQDGAGNLSAPRVISFVVDKVEPSVAMERSVWIRDGHHRLRATVSKPHVTAQLFDGTTPLGDEWELQNGERTISKDVLLVCSMNHPLLLRVRDAAGNVGQAEQIVHCDNVAPSFSVQPSPYVQEKGGQRIELTARVQPDPDAMHLVETDSMPILEKRWDRLDNKPDHAPPTLRFSVSDIEEDSGGIGTAARDLRVSYKYIFRGAIGVRERSWSPVACNERGICEVPFSYQTMLPVDMLSQPTSLIRPLNFIAHSGAADRHSIIIKVEDLAGNRTVAEWSIRLKLFSPPVFVDCQLDNALRAKTLKGPTYASLPEAAAKGSPAAYVNLTTTFTVDSESLTPDDGAHAFTFPEAEMEWGRVKFFVSGSPMVERSRRHGTRRSVDEIVGAGGGRCGAGGAF